MFIIYIIILIQFIHLNSYELISVNKNSRSKKKRYKQDSSNLLDKETELLSETQLNRLNQIKSGILSKKDIEIVLARFNEDVTWSNYYSSILTIYDKSEDPKTKLSGENVIHLPNLGRECNTYLHHIVNNYDNLANITVFSQASSPTRGYKGHRNGGGHMLGNSSFHDFVLDPNGHFIFTSALWFPTAAHIIRYGFNTKYVSRAEAQVSCFNISDDKTGIEHNGKFSFSYLKIVDHIAERCESEGSTTCSIPTFWDQYIKLGGRPYKDVVFFAQGAVFSASAAQIRRRPLSEYASLLQQCSLSPDTSAGFFMEWLWYYLVTSDRAPCPHVTGHEFDWATKLPYYEHLDFPSRAKFANITEALYIYGSDKLLQQQLPKKRKLFHLRSF
jgi:hypothetical protein